MVPWRFLDYVTIDGRNPIQEWYAMQDDAVKAALDFTIHQLKVTDDWLLPKRRKSAKQFSLLDGKHSGLGELRFWPEDRRIFRVPGIYRQTEREFIMFGGCEKRLRGIIQIPPDAFDVALKLKFALEAGKGRVIDHV
jgi:hypothetical protein